MCLCCGVAWVVLYACCWSRIVSVVLLLVRSWTVIVVLLVVCLLREKKQDLTSIGVPQNKTTSAIVHKLHRKGFISITGPVNSKNSLHNVSSVIIA